MNINRTSIRIASVLVSVGMVLGLSGAAYASGTTYYVDNTGTCSDTNPGTQTQPWCTIGKAATTMVAGDTALVHGTFTAAGTNPTNSGTVTAPITFQANAALGGATFNGGTTAFAVSSRSYITVKGVTVGLSATSHTTGYSISVGGGRGVVISRNTISYAGTPAQSQTKAGIYVSGLNGGTISGNVTHDNSAHGISI